jgi:hypothetical protein
MPGIEPQYRPRSPFPVIAWLERATLPASDRQFVLWRRRTSREDDKKPRARRIYRPDLGHAAHARERERNRTPRSDARSPATR